MKFSQRVLNQCKKIPKGKVSTYKEIAKSLGTKAFRAVGTALKNNPYSPIVPCHRVVKSDGSLGGYKGRLNSQQKLQLLRKEGIKIKSNKIQNFKEVIFKL